MTIVEKFNSGRVPAKRLADRGDKDFYAIVHFSMNTFTDKEWGYGDEDPQLFNPVDFDAEQIVSACKDAGMSGVILVCKHHDGFCLWPTKTTEHNISKSPFRGGKGDLVREFSDACRKLGVEMGFYVSPWDRNNASYGTPAYLEIYREQLREIYSNYGPAFEAWFDGANGGDGYYGGARTTRKIDNVVYYDWYHTWDIVRELQPDACIFSDIGPDLRWVGNERGFADAEAFGSISPAAPDGMAEAVPGGCKPKENTVGHADGRFYIPPECDVPLRPGWFFHENQNDSLRSVKLLLKIYVNSVGNGGFLNLGISPDRRGLLHENDVKRLKEFRDAIDALFSNKIAETKADIEDNATVLEFGKNTGFNMIFMKEDLSQGERISSYEVEVRQDGVWKRLFTGKAVSRKRIRTFRMQNGDAVRVKILNASAPVKNLYLAAYLVPEDLLEDDAATAAKVRDDYHKIVPEKIEGNSMTFRLSEKKKICGFIFTPVTSDPKGTPDRYSLYADGVKVAEGEFSNVRANPIPQEVSIAPVEATALTFVAERYLEVADKMAVREFGLIY